MIYFKERVLFVEICGRDTKKWHACEDFHELGKAFLLFHRIIRVNDLRGLLQKSYNLHTDEVSEIIALIRDYLKIKPWLQNFSDMVKI